MSELEQTLVLNLPKHGEIIFPQNCRRWQITRIRKGEI